MTSLMNGTSSSTLHLRSKRSTTTTEEAVVPDSTTIEKGMTEFSIGQDVLVKQKDGRYYLGTTVEVDSIREQCLIKFGDNTENWSSFKDLTKLTEQEDLLCVVCKKSVPKKKKEITVCDKCGRGYHQKCHQPEIPNECQRGDATWVCKRCMIQNGSRLGKSDLRQVIKKEKLTINDSIHHQSHNSRTKVLPYDLNSLNWDTYHRINIEHTYCYCGENGEWYRQMLQCARCKQWFHEKCIYSLQYPLYCGDRFYVFVCSVCNHGKEFLRRLEVKWVDLVHLMLFNLTAFNSKKYYDLDTIIIPYINDNWYALQLPPKIFGVSKTERRENILSVLTNNRNRFKCGREIKKRTTIWGLRVRLPPPAPTVTISLSGMVTENELKEMWQGNRRLQFLPKRDSEHAKIIPLDNHVRSIMMGVAYLQNNNPSETDSPCPSPEIEQDLEDKLYNSNKNNNNECVAKKSVPLNNVSIQRRRRLLSVNSRERLLLKKPKRRNTNDGIYNRTDEGGGGGGGVSGINVSGGGYSTRLSLIEKNNFINNKTNNNDTMPLTPPTSLSAPPTPPASGSNSLLSDLSNDFSEPSFKINKKDPNNDRNTPSCDTSGDETSSKSTLDLIIPPPKDFEGKNNPFLALLRGNTNDRLKKKKLKDSSITLPLPLTAVIPGKPVMIPKKRKLSEKDIFIGPNGEVKRRRLRRNRQNTSNNATSSSATVYNMGQTASKTATVLPAKSGDAKEWGQHTTNWKLRQRPEKSTPDTKNSKTTSTITTPKPSPVKQEPDINMDELKSSVNIYFGAANRIAAGERYTIKAKRVGPTGKLEFLIEWDGPGNGMT